MHASTTTLDAATTIATLLLAFHDDRPRHGVVHFVELVEMRHATSQLTSSCRWD